MIQIEDNDSPIMAAYKIIHGIKVVSWTPASKLGYILATGKTPKEGSEAEVDMFSDEEIREITEHLQVYLKNHEDQDDETKEREQADGCQGCEFESTEEWEMPCAKCRRACKDYWRAKTWQTEKQ